MDEVVKSQTAIRNGINNTLPINRLEAVTAVANYILEPVREYVGVPFSPSSWYRSPELNKLKSRSTNSQHMTGEAVDFEIPGRDNFEIACWIEDNLEYDQLILEFYNEKDVSSGWIHCSYSLTHNRRQSLRTPDGIRYYKGLHDA